MIYSIGFKTKQTISCTIDDVIRYCSKQKVLGLDTETTGLDPHIDKIVMFQIGDQTNQFIIDARKLL
jgi:ribonuclease D